jgi:uncharacterized protein YbaR (Trm112 family)
VWQYDYDLVWSIKPDDKKTSEVSSEQIEVQQKGQNLRGLATLRCPKCCTPLDRAEVALTCRSCGRRYPIGTDGVIELL